MNGAGGLNAYMSDDDYDDYSTLSKPSSGNTGSSGNYYGSCPSGSGGPSSGSLSSSYLSGGTGGGGSSSRNQVCCLLDDSHRCHRIAGNASYSKRIQRTAFYKRLKLEIDTNVINEDSD